MPAPIGHRVITTRSERSVESLPRSAHRSDRSRFDIELIDGSRIGCGIALVLGTGPEDPPVVKYALPYLEIDDGHGSCRFMLGEPPTDPRTLTITATDASVTLDGRDVVSWRTSADVDPLEALAWMRSELAGEGASIQPGEIVLTGWLAELGAIEPGRVVADLGDVGSVSCRIIDPDGPPPPDDGPRWGEVVGEVAADAPLSVGAFEAVYDPEDDGRGPWCVNDHCFVEGPDGTWHLFAITHLKPYNHALDPGTQLGHATADDLVRGPWHTQTPALHAEPANGEHLLWAPHVVHEGDRFHMFVCVGAAQGDLFAIHRYESLDLWDWRRTDGPPVLVDGVEARDPMVLRDGDRWILYYTATETASGGRYVVAAATSPDLVTWSERRIVFTHPREGAFGGPTESPFVVRRGPRAYLFITDDDVVHVYASDDPMSWSVEDHVYAYRGRACEVIRDEAGEWFISHVGWEHGGISLAPLSWRDGLDDAPASIEPAAGR